MLYQQQSETISSFIANQVQTIRNLSDLSQWKNVDTKVNAADEASQGLGAKAVHERQCCPRGPRLLWQREKNWSAQPLSLGDVSTKMKKSRHREMVV